MNNEEWKKVERALGELYSVVQLKIDGCIVEYQLQRKNAMKNVIMTYVDGGFRGEWLLNEYEGREKKFMRKCEKSLFPEKNLKGLTTKQKIKFKKEKYSYLSPFWNSFKTLKMQLCTRCENIELVEIRR